MENTLNSYFNAEIYENFTQKLNHDQSSFDYEKFKILYQI